jgi:glucose-1-phosphate thymidylyltransferase
VPVKVVGVLPAAGRAERLQPLPVSKEVLEVGGRPVLEYVVERMRAARPKEIRIVIRPEKADVRKHAARLGLAVLEARPETVSRSIEVGLDGLADDDIALLGFPDSLWEPLDGFGVLLEALIPAADAVLGVFHSSEPERGDVVELDDDVALSVHVKSANPPGDRVWGCAVGRVGALRTLDRHEQPGGLFDELARRGRVRAVRFPSEFIDIGTREALEHARELHG